MNGASFRDVAAWVLAETRSLDLFGINRHIADANGAWWKGQNLQEN